MRITNSPGCGYPFPADFCRLTGFFLHGTVLLREAVRRDSGGGGDRGMRWISTIICKKRPEKGIFEGMTFHVRF